MRRTKSLFAVAVATSLLLACGDEGPTSTQSNRGDLRIQLPGVENPDRSGDFDFGEVAVGSSKRVTLQLLNVGSDLARVKATRFEDAPAGTFFAQPPAEVPAGGTADLTLTFSPTAKGTATGRMVIEHDGSSVSASLNLSGTGK